MSDDDDPATARIHSRPARTGFSAVNWLLLLPLASVLYPPLYNRVTPSLLGIPFFYWYQLALIPFSAICVLVVFRWGSRPSPRRSAAESEFTPSGD